MPDQTLTEMNDEAFHALIDNYIDRIAEEGDDMPAATFFELLFERATQQVTETVEVEGELVNNPGLKQSHMRKRATNGKVVVVTNKKTVGGSNAVYHGR